MRRAGSPLREGVVIVGLEIAPPPRPADSKVTVVEAQPGPLSGAVGPEVSERTAARHAATGVQLLMSSRVESIAAAADTWAVTLVSGERLARPARRRRHPARTRLAPRRPFGRVRWDRGGRVLPTGARGRLRRWRCREDPGSPAGPELRVEHWRNALDIADTAAADIAGAVVGPLPGRLPYFWSHEQDDRWHMLGKNRGHDEVVRIDRSGHDPERAALLAYLRRGRVVAVLAQNWPTAMRAAEALVASGGNSEDLHKRLQGRPGRLRSRWRRTDLRT